jgi:hypothetical protein
MRQFVARLLLPLVLLSLLPVNGSIAAESSEPTPMAVMPKMGVAAELPPKMFNPIKQKLIVVKLKSAAVFTVKNPEIWRGRVVDPRIAKFVSGGPYSAYETYPSLTLFKRGKTTITLTDGKKTYFLKLTVL